MKYLTHTVAIAGLVACFGSGAFAQDTDFAKMTCADFAGMSGEEQATAYTSIKDANAMTKSGSKDATASTDKSAAGSDTSSTAAPSTDSAASGTASGSAAPADTTSSTDMEPNADVTALLNACEGNDDAFAMEHVQ